MIVLVDYLIRKNLIESFLEVCLSDEVNQQTELNQFYQDSQKIKYKPIFDNCNFKNLINILHKINQNNLFITLYKNYQETYNDHQKTILEQKKYYLSTNQQPEYLIINELLILMDSEISEAGIVSDVIKPNDSLVLVDFVEKFLIKILTIQEIDNALKKDLKEWIENNCPEAYIEVNREEKSVNNFIDYLFIVIRRGLNKDNPRFFLQKAEFVEFNKNHEKIKELPINLGANDINHQYYLEKEIPGLINELINKMYECVDPSTPPVIELFLPFSLLAKDFDVNLIDINRDSDYQKPICVIYPFIVRCYERCFEKNIFKVNWRNQWRSLQQIINKLDNNQELISKRIGVLSQQNFTYLNSYVALKIICPLPQTDKERENFFRDILITGVPLCLWTRYKDIKNINNIIESFEEILNVKSFQDFCQFYKEIMKIRSKNISNEDDLGYKLGVLFDDYDVMPSKDIKLAYPNQFIAE